MDFRSGCPVSTALDVVGDRWTLLVIRDLALGKRTFKELSAAPEQIASNILTDRLRRLEAIGIVTRSQREYTLTERGLGLLPVLVEIGRWSERHLQDENPALVKVFDRYGASTDEIVRNVRARLTAAGPR